MDNLVLTLLTYLGIITCSVVDEGSNNLSHYHGVTQNTSSVEKCSVVKEELGLPLR